MTHILFCACVLFCVPGFAHAEAPATREAKEESKKTEVADSKKLQEALPEKLGSLERTNVSGERVKQANFDMATAEASYGKPEGESPKTIEIQVIDYGAMPEFATGIAVWEKIDMDREGDDGFTRIEAIDGRKVMISYGNADKHGSIQQLLNGRLLITIEASNFSADEVMALAKEFNPATLAAAAPAAK